MADLTVEERELLRRLLENLGLTRVCFDGRTVSATLPPARQTRA